MAVPSPSERELQALKILWAYDGATIHQIAAALGAQGERLAYTTILSLLQVMEQKGLVGHRRQGKAYVYLPKIPRDRTFRRLAGEFLDRVFDGAVDQYLVHAMDAKQLSDSELDELERRIIQAKRSKSRSSKPRPRKKSKRKGES